VALVVVRASVTAHFHAVKAQLVMTNHAILCASGHVTQLFLHFTI